MKTTLFGHTYDAPFGISPVGLQGLVWPNAAEILAKAAFDHNIPFILSTVATTSIERISEITEGSAWFQFTYPVEEKFRKSFIERIAATQCPVLVLLCDVPSYGYHAKEIRSGLAMPPHVITLRNIIQVLGKPHWALQTLIYGQPTFAVLKTYMPKRASITQLDAFINKTFSMRFDVERIKQIRDLWKGKIILKGICTKEDAAIAVKLGLDGIIVSNTGGRQLDAAPSTIEALKELVSLYGDKITIMMDSGMRSGPDIARALASGAKFTFMGRSFMYGVAALGKRGGDHTISILKAQLQQVMEQIGCETVNDFPNHLLSQTKDVPTIHLSNVN